MSNRDDQIAAAYDSGHGVPHSDDHRVAAEDLKSILKLIATQLQDVDRRQTEVLAQMQQRLEELGTHTRTTKARVPAAYVPAFERIQDGIHLLIERISENRTVEQPAAQTAAHFGAPVSEKSPEATVREELERIISDAAAVGAAVSVAVPADHLEGSVAHFGDVPELADEPWDTDAAEALARVYETNETGADSSPASHDVTSTVHEAALEDERATPDHLPQYEMASAAKPVSLASPLPAFSALPATAPAEFDRAAHQPAAAHAPAPALDFDRTWLQERFAEIAERVEHSLAEMRPDDSLFALNDRVERMQDDIASALKALPTRDDLEGLRTDEAAFERIATALNALPTREDLDGLRSDDVFEEIAAHIERSTSGLDRIGSIEEKLAHVAAQLSDERFNALISEFAPAASAPAMPEIDFDRIATVAAEAVAERFADFDRGSESATAVQDLREMLERFIAVQREEHVETAGSLDTIQQAMLNILDRVEAIESVAMGHADAPGADAAAVASADVDDMSDEDGEYEPDDSFPGLTSLAAQARADALIDSPPPELPRSNYGSIPSAAPRMPTAAAVGIESEGPSATDEAHDDDVMASAISTELPRMNAIERIRQDFIADAQRAKARAAAEADVAAQATRPLAGSRIAESEKKAGRSILSSLPGLGRGTERSHSAKMDAVLSGSRAANVGQATIFGIRRNTLLIGAFVTLVAVTSALMLMRKDAPVDGATPSEPAAIQRSIDGAQPAAGASGDTAPQLQNRAPERAPVEDNNPFDDPPSSGGKASPSQSSLDGDRQHAAFEGPLPGLEIQNGRRPLSVGQLEEIDGRRSTAELSSRLGNSAAAASPASLMKDFGLAGTGTVTEVVTGAANASQLNLPPATVGPLSLRLAAAKGDPSAQFEVAARLAEGKGTDQNFTEAVRWYERSASQGFAQSMYRLGTLYERGLGVKKDLVQAAAQYRQAAEHGNIKAMHNLAVLSAGSSSGSPDYPTAAQWFEKAAAYGLTDSQYNLAVLYENGLGVNKSQLEAYKFYALSAASGDTEALRRRDEMAAAMTELDRKKANLLVSSWQLKAPDKLANDARAAGEDWKKRADGLYSS